MEGEVILVAVDASKEITDYALEWAIRHVIKPLDSLILLAILPLHESPQASSRNQTNHSPIYQFVTRFLRMRSVSPNDQNSFERTSFDDGVDVAQRINNVCVQMMNNLFSAYNIVQVETQVKVVSDAQMGSVPMAAEALGATWVILDRRLKKEGDHCMKQLNCNIILIDHAIPKILRSAKSQNMKKLNVIGDKLSDPTIADMLGVLPSHNHNSRSSTIRSSSNTDTSLSSSSIDKDQYSQKIRPRARKLTSANSSVQLNSQILRQKVENETIYSSKPPYSRSQPLYKGSIFDSECLPKSTAKTTPEKTKSHSGVLKTKTDSTDMLGSEVHSSNRLTAANSSAQLNSQFLSQTMESEAIYSSKPPYSKSQQLSKVSMFDTKSPRKSTNQTSTLKTKTDMPSVLPVYDHVSQSSTTQSSFGSNGLSSNNDDSFSPSSIDKDQSQKMSPHARRLTSAKSSAQLNSQFHSQTVESEAIYSSIPTYYKSQPLSKVSIFNVEPPRDSTTKSILKTKSADTNRNTSTEGRQETSTPPRRSIDIRHSRRTPRIPNQPRQSITRTEPMSTGMNTSEMSKLPSTPTLDRTSSVRKAMSLSTKQPPKPPPLCSICKNSAPIFGRSPRRFSYEEIKRATDEFSEKNLLAEGGFGTVYRGILHDGQVVAVKKHVALSAQGASEFCSEVEVLSCAQHRNLVMLVGYCIEVQWLLVYEYACNSSLDKHLYGAEYKEVMAWENRLKVAIGAARGLRYLHEDCRVGCIVHRDFRPNNILLTHDFEPMVGDFGLARWQADGQSAEETRVIGAFGYLAPEYTQTGLITEKADVYAFGVVLLELLTGTKATEFSRIGGPQYLPEWSHLLLGKKQCKEIIDPRLENNYSEKELEYMMHAASLCISPHPDRRPRMSKVLKILEGDMPNNMAYNHRKSTSGYPMPNLNGSTTDRYSDNSSSSHLMQSIHHLNLSPSRESLCSFNDPNRKFKPKTKSNGHKMAKEGWEFQKFELLLSEEYQEYLKGSLSKFIHHFNVK